MVKAKVKVGWVDVYEDIRVPLRGYGREEGATNYRLIPFEKMLRSRATTEWQAPKGIPDAHHRVVGDWSVGRPHRRQRGRRVTVMLPLAR